MALLAIRQDLRSYKGAPCAQHAPSRVPAASHALGLLPPGRWLDDRPCGAPAAGGACGVALGARRPRRGS